jgi:hypothetical protein
MSKQPGVGFIPIMAIGFGRIELEMMQRRIVAFVEKAHSSLQSRGRFKQRDCYKRSLLHYAAIKRSVPFPIAA